MQLTAYLFNQEIQARFNKPNTIRNTVFWNKPLKIYKGADNLLDIVVNDFDLQPVAVGAYEFRFKVKNKNHDVVLNKVLGLRAGQNNRLALDLLEEDLSALTVGMYVWGISLRDELGRERPIYLEVNGEAEGTMQLINWFLGAGA